MTGIPIRSIVAASAALTLSLTAAASAQAEPLPYGHKDFVPTPERPIYFRAGNGEYPGATPLLEWRKGTLAMMKLAGPYGNPPQYRTNEVIGFSDAVQEHPQGKHK